MREKCERHALANINVRVSSDTLYYKRRRGAARRNRDRASATILESQTSRLKKQTIANRSLATFSRHHAHRFTARLRLSCILMTVSSVCV